MNCYEILPGRLWQTGVVGEMVAPQVDLIIDTAGHVDPFQLELQGVSPPIYVRIPYADAPLKMDDEAFFFRLKSVAALGARLLLAEHRVLCHCTGGVNRSSLMTGLILLSITKYQTAVLEGWTPGVSIVEFIRSRRPGALSNPSFVEYLQKESHN